MPEKGFFSVQLFRTVSIKESQQKAGYEKTQPK
jgi:hypothetical protein